MIKAVLTDIEGTTSSISFVKDVLFPYARERIPEFVKLHGRETEVRRILDEAAVLADSKDDEALCRGLHFVLRIFLLELGLGNVPDLQRLDLLGLSAPERM